MSQENIEALQRAADANNRQDYEAFLEEFDPDVEWHGIFGVMFGGEATVVRGHEGLLRYVRDLDEGFDVRDVQFLEFRDLGDRIVGLGHVRGRGRESGIDFDSPYGGLAEFKNGKCIWYRDYFDHSQALKAAGLSEEAMSSGNVEAMRGVIEAFNRGDGGAFDRYLASDPEVVPVRAALEGTIYRGADAGTQYCTAVDQSWEDLGWDVEEIRDGGDAILALGHIRGKGRDSGVAIDATAGWLAHFSEGRIKRFQTFADRHDALKAAGLSE